MDDMNEPMIGERIALIHTNDPYTQLVPGSEGTVRYVRFDGSYNVISVKWDNGSQLSLIEGKDSYLILSD